MSDRPVPETGAEGEPTEREWLEGERYEDKFPVVGEREERLVGAALAAVFGDGDEESDWARNDRSAVEGRLRNFIGGVLASSPSPPDREQAVEKVHAILLDELASEGIRGHIPEWAVSERIVKALFDRGDES